MKVIKNDCPFIPIESDAELTVTLTGSEIALIYRALPLLRNNLISGCLHSLELKEDLKNAYYTELLFQDFEKFCDMPF